MAFRCELIDNIYLLAQGIVWVDWPPAEFPRCRPAIETRVPKPGRYWPRLARNTVYSRPVGAGLIVARLLLAWD